jgi:glycosyltransferase involved in cell wall biosynthesis
LLPDKDRSLEGHSNGWESREIARILTRFGYRTDVIDYGDSGFLPDEKYDLVLDIHGNLQRLAPFLPPRALKLLHMTGSYPGYSNHRELERIDALEKRKGLLYGPKRIVDSILFDRSLKLADACSLIGNEWTRNTYPAQYREKITLVTVSASRLSRVKSPSEYFREGRLDFIWFFGGGAVHKGLDLTLDAFSLEPEFHLHVVGPIEAEPDFVKIYKKELYNTANITFHGYLSPSSIQFEKVIDKCCCFIAPSCSESISTAVATMLQVGLYPIISRDTGITLPKGCGMYLEDLTVEEIRRMVHRVNESAHGTLCEEMRQIQENALAAYSRQAFGERMNYYINAVLMRVGML